MGCCNHSCNKEFEIIPKRRGSLKVHPIPPNSQSGFMMENVWNGCWGDNHSSDCWSEKHSKWFEVYGKICDFMVSASEVMKRLKAQKLKLSVLQMDCQPSHNYYIHRTCIFNDRGNWHIYWGWMGEQRLQIPLCLPNKLYSYQRLNLTLHTLEKTASTVDCCPWPQWLSNELLKKMFFWAKIILG